MHINAAVGTEKVTKTVTVRVETEIKVTIDWPKNEPLTEDDVEDWVMNQREEELLAEVKQAGLSFVGANW